MEGQGMETAWKGAYVYGRKGEHNGYIGTVGIPIHKVIASGESGFKSDGRSTTLSAPAQLPPTTFSLTLRELL